jgi:hypothetical protein
MAGLVPAIHVFSCSLGDTTWMPGTRPGMTKKKFAAVTPQLSQLSGVANAIR